MADAKHPEQQLDMLSVARQAEELPAMYTDMARSAVEVDDAGIMNWKNLPGLRRAFKDGCFRVSPTDVFVVGYPKTGTNWTWQLACQILCKGDPQCMKQVVWVPHIEASPSGDLFTPEKHCAELSAIEGVRVFTSHLLFEDLPPDVQAGKCKIIFMVRNPKDVAVSFYFFLLAHKVLHSDTQWNEFFDNFLHSKVPQGSWFDYMNRWLKHKDKQHVMFVQYENMKQNTKQYILDIARFLERPLTDEEADLVLENTKLDKSRKEFKEKMSETYANPEIFARKGIVGDWRNVFTVAQAEEIDKLYRAKIVNCDFNYV